MSYDSRVSSILLSPLAIDLTFGLQEFYRYKTSDGELSFSEAKAVRELGLSQRKATIYTCSTFEPTLADGIGEIKSIKNQSVAVVPLIGTMLADGGLSTPSIDFTSSQLEAAAANPNIAGIVLRTNSGGGEVTAAQRLSNTLQGINKPVVMFVDGMAASGAYWSGCYCNEIIMGGATTRVGSIGVVFDLDKRVIEDIKANYKYILSDGSEGKRANVEALINGDDNYFKVNALNPIMKHFRDVVIKGRANAKNPLDMSFIKTDGNDAGGRMTKDANEAIRAGLADSKGTLQDAMKRVIALSKRYKRKDEKAQLKANFNRIKTA